MTFQASVLLLLLLLGRKLKTYVYESRYAKTLAIATITITTSNMFETVNSSDFLQPVSAAAASAACFATHRPPNLNMKHCR